MSISESIPPQINKRCTSCIEIKLLIEYDFNSRSRDGRSRTCKECNERKQHKICTCPCDNCKDEKLLEGTYSLMELMLTRIDEGLVVPDDFRELIMMLATSSV